MKYLNCLFLIVFFSSMSIFSQEKYKQHSVANGETISKIAQNYNISTSDIYELNPDARNGIKAQAILLIPTKSIKKTNFVSSEITNTILEKNHEVLPKETLYGIAKKYCITVDNLFEINPNLEKEGLKTGQSIKISITPKEDFTELKKAKKIVEVKNTNLLKKNSAKDIVNDKIARTEISSQDIEYEILQGESLFSIAKKFGINLVNLQKANPQLVNSDIKVGQKINVPVKKKVDLSLSVDKFKKKNELNSEKELTVSLKPIQQKKESLIEIIHVVLPKESLYSIAKHYGIPFSELLKTNSEIENKSLKVGQKIVISVKSDPNSNLVMKDNELKNENKITIVPKNEEDKKVITDITHEVLTKETKYGIAKKYGLTVIELEKQNPKILNNLLVGDILKIRSAKLIDKSLAIDNTIVPEVDLVIEKTENNEINIVHDESFIKELISRASENIGVSYRSGGITNEGFDCSGFVWHTFNNYDIKLPRSSVEMASYGSKVDIQNAQKGDLIFFKTRGSGRINHVGLVVEVLDGEIKFIHSATHGGVMISSTKESYYEKNLAQINRVL